MRRFHHVVEAAPDGGRLRLALFAERTFVRHLVRGREHGFQLGRQHVLGRRAAGRVEHHGHEADDRALRQVVQVERGRLLVQLLLLAGRVAGGWHVVARARAGIGHDGQLIGYDVDGRRGVWRERGELAAERRRFRARRFRVIVVVVVIVVVDIRRLGGQGGAAGFGLPRGQHDHVGLLTGRVRRRFGRLAGGADVLRRERAGMAGRTRRRARRFALAQHHGLLSVTAVRHVYAHRARRAAGVRRGSGRSGLAHDGSERGGRRGGGLGLLRFAVRRRVRELRLRFRITENVTAVRVRAVVGRNRCRVNVVLRLPGIDLVLTGVHLEVTSRVTAVRLAGWRVVGQWSTGRRRHRVTGTGVLRVRRRVGLLCSVVGNVGNVNSLLALVRRLGARFARVTCLSLID